MALRWIQADSRNLLSKWIGQGFEDDDFTLANATAEGVYVRFRAKFDQGTAKGLFDWLGGK